MAFDQELFCDYRIKTSFFTYQTLQKNFHRNIYLINCLTIQNETPLRCSNKLFGVLCAETLKNDLTLKISEKTEFEEKCLNINQN